MSKIAALLVFTVVGSGGLMSACTVNSTTNNNGANEDGGANGPDGTTDTSTGDDAANDANIGTDSGADAGTDAASPQTNIRFADWSPDAPATGFDFCVAAHGTTNWTGPVLGSELADAGTIGDGGANSLQFPLVTAYLAIDPGQYDVEIVSAGATSCASGVVPATTTLPTLAANAFTTFAVVGDVSMAGSDPGLKVVAFADDSTAATGALVRFINAAPDLAAVDVGQGTLAGGNFQALFTGVQFGQPGTAAGSDAGAVDSNGYVSLAALSGARLSVHTSAGGTSDTATASNATFATGTISTLALVNGKNGGPAPQFLQCQDNAATTGLLSPCSVLSP
jgi:hypothetical protein